MGLKGDIGRGLSSVATAASSASISVATLAELDLAKSRMEAACSTLQVCLPAHPYGYDMICAIRFDSNTSA